MNFYVEFRNPTKTEVSNIPVDHTNLVHIIADTFFAAQNAAFGYFDYDWLRILTEEQMLSRIDEFPGGIVKA